MLRGVYTSTAGMLTDQQRQKTISENLSNVNTPGFQAGQPAVSPFGHQLLHRLSAPDNPNPLGLSSVVGSLQPGSRVADVALNKNPGQLKETGRPLDIALTGPGYLVVETAGGPRLTRRGQLEIDAEGFLTAEGQRVMAVDGTLQIDDGAEASIDSEGRLHVDGQPSGQLAVAVVPDGARLRRDDRGLLQLEGVPLQAALIDEPGDAEVTVQAGHLEMSNVDVVGEMGELLSALRGYGANHTAFTLQNRTLDDVLRLLEGL